MRPSGARDSEEVCEMGDFRFGLETFYFFFFSFSVGRNLMFTVAKSKHAAHVLFCF